jgi:putative SOS response-associated peptidase YedK
MCGRFHRFDDVQKMATQFRAKYDESLFAPPTYNAPPQTWQPVIRLDQDGEREIVNMRCVVWLKAHTEIFGSPDERAIRCVAFCCTAKIEQRLLLYVLTIRSINAKNNAHE